MRSVIMLLVMAVGIVFLATQWTAVRIEDRTRAFEARSDTPARAVRARPTARTVKSGMTEKPIDEIPIKGQPKVSREDAYNDALERAAEAIEDYFSLRTPLQIEDVKRLIRDKSEKTVPLGDNLPDAKQFELLLQVDSKFLSELAQIQREARMSDRMQILARGLAVAVAALFAIAGYVRLDEWSKGYYSGLLKAVAVLAVIGIGIAAWIK
jgi:hypothetical protein